MKTFLKFIASLLTLPFLVPWYLADKTFEYLFQPSIFKRYNLAVEKRKVWVLRVLKFAIPLLILWYLTDRFIDFLQFSGDFMSAARDLGTFFISIYNDFARAFNWMVGPLNRFIYYLRGGPLDFWDFMWSAYLCFIPVIFLANLLYRLIGTYYAINHAARLRDKAIRDVDIVRFSEGANPDQIFMGLDLNKQGRPLYAHKSWLKGHLQIIGGPGSGKTESIIQPIWFQQVQRNVPTFVLDGKATRSNIDKFYTIASSLAQGHEIFYFNPGDPARSDSYNPLLRGTVSDVKHKIMSSIDWQLYSTSSREKLDTTLDVFLQIMQDTHRHFNMKDLLDFFTSKKKLATHAERMEDDYLVNSLNDIMQDYNAFQTSMGFFIGILRNLCQSGYSQLLNTNDPGIDIVEAYLGRKDCYFTLPMHSNEETNRFLGRLIIQDFIHSFNRIAMNDTYYNTEDGLLIVDGMSRFAGPEFIKLLQNSRTIGVSVCYTNQSLAELDDPDLGLSHQFVGQLIDHTNGVCAFQLGNPEGIQEMLNRFGKIDSDKDSGKLDISDPDFLRHLEVGKCILFFRQPRYISVLKTGYFKFDKLLRFDRKREDGSDRKKAWSGSKAGSSRLEDLVTK